MGSNEKRKYTAGDKSNVRNAEKKRGIQTFLRERCFCFQLRVQAENVEEGGERRRGWWVGEVDDPWLHGTFHDTSAGANCTEPHGNVEMGRKGASTPQASTHNRTQSARA